MPEPKPTQSLKLLIAGIRWPPETFLASLVDGLLRSGVQVTVAGANRPSPDWLSKPGFTWLPVPAWQGNSLLRLMRLAWQAGSAWLTAPKDMQILCKQIQISGRLNERLRLWQRWSPYAGKHWDVIYFPWNSGAIEHLGLFDLGMPVVISCRGSQINIAPHNPMRSLFREKLIISLEKAKFVHCVSDHTRLEAVKLNASIKKSKIIRPAINTDFFFPLTPKISSSSIYNIVSIGTLNWVKGYEYALVAIHNFKKRGIPFHYRIIGKGPDEQRIRYTIHDLELEQQVELVGQQPPEIVRKRLQEADVFLLSSLSEGIANAALEAMACGIPVVTTDCGGMREAVTDGVEGLVTPLRQPEAMAQALQKLWQEPTLRQQMGNNGRKRVLADFNLDQQVSRFMDLFQQAL